MFEGETSWSLNGCYEFRHGLFGGTRLWVQETRIKNQFRRLEGQRALRRISRWRRAQPHETAMFTGKPA